MLLPVGGRRCWWWSRRLCSVVGEGSVVGGVVGCGRAIGCVLLLLEYSSVEYLALFFGGGRCSVVGGTVLRGHWVTDRCCG